MPPDSQSPADPAPAPAFGRRRPDLGESLLALATVAFGAVVLWQTTQIRLTPAYSQVGPRVIPYVVGAGLVLLGLLLLVEGLSGRSAPPSTESEDADPTLPTDWRTVGLLGVALVLFLVLIETAGFVLASAVLFLGAALAMGSRHILRDAAFGLLLATGLFVGFTRGLGLDLPSGVLGGLL